MDYSLFVWSIATVIEAKVKEEIPHSLLERSVGFSYRHIREVFKKCTGISLSRYILIRRLSNAAFEIVHSQKSLTEIASKYMFSSYDGFTRAFKRYTNITPSSFRKKEYSVGRKRLLMGMYGPVILKEDNVTFSPRKISEVEENMSNIRKTDTSCILYGVPKVAYSFEECTPFAVALKACLNYMGQKMNYGYIMATTGAAFRLRWNTKIWDGGNIDIMNIYEDEYEAFKRGFRAAGRKYKILKRKNATKEDFIEFIKFEINEGRPVIALGIIGPPEACLVTGYREDGRTLLGWNCFQENQEFASTVEIDESGYFISNDWWENKETIAVMSIGEEQQELVPPKEIIENAINIMTKEVITFKDRTETRFREYAGGQYAYDLWANSIENDCDFSKDAVLPILIERLMCQNDAQAMVGEGRSYAAFFIEWVGQKYEEVLEESKEVARIFRAEAECTFKMNEIKGGFMQSEKTARKFAEAEVRKKIGSLIGEAKEYDRKACKLLKKIVSQL